MMKHSRFAPAALVAALALSACSSAPVAPPQLAPGERLARVERIASSPGATAAELARAGFTAWLVTGDAAQASRWLDRALAKDAAEPLALYAKSLLAREALDEQGVAEAALALLRKAPDSALAELAAQRVYEVAQVSPAIDARIEEALAPLATSAAGLRGKAAVLAREALLAVRDGSNEDAKSAALRAALGVPTAWTLVGPLGAYRLRDFDSPSPFDDRAHVLQSSYKGAAGDVRPRVLPTPGGLLSLDGETWRGDVFEALVDLDVKDGGVHLVSLRGAGMALATIDGATIVRRTTYPERAPERSWGAVSLAKGRHRLRVRFTRAEGSWLSLNVARADGAPSRIATSAPVVGGPVLSGTAEPASMPAGAAETYAALTKADPSEPLGWFLRLRAALADDAEWARHHVDRLVAAAGESAAVRALRVDLVAGDPDLPRETAASRVGRDLAAIVTAFPDWARAQLLLVEQERGDKRWDDAAARLATLDGVLGKGNARLLLVRARFANERGDRAGARRLAEAAIAADPGRCDAVDFRFDQARRDDEVRRADELAGALLRCPGGLAANAQLLRQRGRLADARALAERLVARNPTSIAARRALADLSVALGDHEAAVAALEPASVMWPARGDVLRGLSDLAEHAGDAAAARRLRERALATDGSDLTLARAVALDRGTDVLAWAERDGLAAIEDYRRSGFRSNAEAVQVLDLGAFELAADGSAMERVHSIVQVLDKKGIDRFGEVTIPGEAQALVVRTVKADGRVLEAESIAGKDSISLPNLEPGDFVEYAFVRAQGPRPAGLAGFQGGQFFFQGADVPYFESAYYVRVPASVALEIDSSGIADLPAPVREGDSLTFRYARHRSDAYLREPLAVSDGEVLPWVELGAGARIEDNIRLISDWAVLRARPTGEVEELVRGLGSLPASERVRAIVARVREQVKGDSPGADLSEPAGSILARGRGNRLVVLKAALAATGIRSHFVAARSFGSNPHAFRFPRGDLYSAVVLRIEPDGVAPIWMDFALRHAPVGRLPPSLSEADAFVVPEPGEDVQRITLPKVDPSLDRIDSDMELALDAEGTLTGTITQTAHGFDAANLRRRFEQVNQSELRKAQERMLSSTFRGVELESLDVDVPADPEKAVTVRTAIRARRFGLRPDGSVALPANFGAQQLGPRFLARADRRTPMLLGQTELSRVRVSLALPKGLQPRVPDPVDLRSPFGRFTAIWSIADGRLSLSEETLLERARIEPARYAEFKRFAASVDAAQAREIHVRSGAATGRPPRSRAEARLAPHAW